jgi:hypothetical protein
MHVQLRYQRLPKPRGGWRYPLEYFLGVVFRDAAERNALEFSRTIAVTAVRPVAGPPDITAASWIAGGAQIRYEGIPYYLRLSRTDDVVEIAMTLASYGRRDTVHFLTAAHRELFVGVLHEWYAQLRKAVAEWWAGEAAPVEGDVAPTILEYDPEEVPAAAPVGAVRRIQIA